VNQGDAVVARLRLFLAAIESREKQLQAVRRQSRDQMERVVGFALYRDATLDQTLAMMSEVDDRVQMADRTLEHLGHLRDRVRAELESLLLTRQIEEAKAQLVDLQVRKTELDPMELGGTTPELTEVEAEIRRLQALIEEATSQAVRSLSTRDTHGRA
jgi:hypothetical protein